MVTFKILLLIILKFLIAINIIETFQLKIQINKKWLLKSEVILQLYKIFQYLRTPFSFFPLVIVPPLLHEETHEQASFC